MTEISPLHDGDPLVDWDGTANWSMRRRTAFIVAASAGCWVLLLGVGYIVVALL